jgi:hypothetical protein
MGTTELHPHFVVMCGRLTWMNENVVRNVDCHGGLKFWPQITPNIFGDV